MTAPRQPRRHQRRLPGGFVLVCVASILSGCHLFLSSSTSLEEQRRDIQALPDPPVVSNETIQQVLADMLSHSLSKSKEMKHLQQKIKSLEKQLKQKQPAVSIRNDNSNTIKEDSFCMPWHISMDDWWTHHPDWELGKENTTHYCFVKIADPEKASFLRQVYENQFHGDCALLTTKRMLNAGFGADMDHVIDGLLYGLQTSTPVQIHEPKQWHYASLPKGYRAACPTKDFYCYFLNLTKCKPNTLKAFQKSFLTEGYQKQEGIGRWLLEYTMRAKTELRKAVYDFTSRIPITTPCTVLHVRRSDVVLHGNWSRKYRAMDEYVTAMKNITSNTNILLLTDDANAITEATSKFPKYNWIYIPRKRHKGAEGGFENQVPSQNPRQEVIIILSILKLVRNCDSLVHTYGNFAELLIGEMTSPKFQRVNLDQGEDKASLFSAKNALSVNVSSSYA